MPYTFSPPVFEPEAVVLRGIFNEAAPVLDPAAAPDSFLELPYCTPDLSSGLTMSFLAGRVELSVSTLPSIAGGGVIAGTDLSTERIYDIAPEKVQATGGNIFVFKRQQ